jgi:hypothetical protein
MESIKRAMIGASVALAASEVWAYRPRPPKQVGAVGRGASARTLATGIIVGQTTEEP